MSIGTDRDTLLMSTLSKKSNLTKWPVSKYTILLPLVKDSQQNKRLKIRLISLILCISPSNIDLVEKPVVESE
jgi:hypothetical protein